MSHPLEIDPVFEAKLQRADVVVKGMRSRAGWIAIAGMVPFALISVLLVDWNESLWGIGWLVVGFIVGNVLHALAISYSLKRLRHPPDEIALVHDVMRAWGLLPVWRSFLTSSYRGY